MAFMDKHITPSLALAIKQQRKRLKRLRKLREMVALLDQRRQVKHGNPAGNHQ